MRFFLFVLSLDLHLKFPLRSRIVIGFAEAQRPVLSGGQVTTVSALDAQTRWLSQF